MSVEIDDVFSYKTTSKIDEIKTDQLNRRLVLQSNGISSSKHYDKQSHKKRLADIQLDIDKSWIVELERKKFVHNDVLAGPVYKKMIR